MACFTTICWVPTKECPLDSHSQCVEMDKEPLEMIGFLDGGVWGVKYLTALAV